MATTDPLDFSIANADGGGPVIDVGVAATLVASVTNRSGTDIPLVAGATPATLTLGLPAVLFSSTELRAMSVSATGWLPSADTVHCALVLRCTTAGTWAQGQTLTFTIGNVVSAASPQTQTVNLAPSNMTGNVPFLVQASLTLKNRPVPGNLSLAAVLGVSLGGGGSVYRSSPSDPLTNTLVLNLQNVRSQPIATVGTRVGNPQVTVTFVYGSTAGALAPADGGASPPQGSAWSIVATPQSLGSAWVATNPRWDGETPEPSWVLKPATTNFSVLGPAATDAANATFSLTEVISFTPPGFTQVLVLCTGFARDAQTSYDDHLFVLGLDKLDPPPTRGLLSFNGDAAATAGVIAVADPAAPVSVPLRWTMFQGVARVRLVTSAPSVPALERSYPNPAPLAYDSATVTVPPLVRSEPLFATLQAFDGTGTYLNALQFAVLLEALYVVDPAGRTYPTRLFGATWWMTADYAYATAEGSWWYRDIAPPSGSAQGRMYDWPTAEASAPDGWTLPGAQDWNDLISLAGSGSGSAAYAALVSGGSAGFSALLGGLRTPQPGGTASYNDLGVRGFYWAAAPPSTATELSSASSSVTILGTPLATGTGASVRYIRRA